MSRARVPLVAGLLLYAGELAVYAAYTALFNRVSGADAAVFLWYPEVVFAAMLALYAVLPTASRAAARRDLEALAPHLDAPVREPATAGFDRRWEALALPLGAAAGLALNFSPGIWATGAVPASSHPDFIWGLFRNPLLLALVFRAVAVEIALSLSFARVGRRAHIDLLDAAAAVPFTRFALRSVLIWFVGASLVSTLLLGDWSADWVVLSLGLITVLGVGALLLPLRGVHESIADAKRAELARVRVAIRCARGDLLREPDAGDAPGAARSADARGEATLAELLAWEARVDRVREWPFDAPALRRFGLYLGIPLGSWLGGALVERIVDRFLD